MILKVPEDIHSSFWNSRYVRQDSNKLSRVLTVLTDTLSHPTIINRGISMAKNVMNCDLMVIGAGGSGLENMELVNAKDKKGTPDLFAAGDNAQAMDGGMGWCPTSGYMAGIAAAKYMGFGPGLVRLI